MGRSRRNSVFYNYGTYGTVTRPDSARRPKKSVKKESKEDLSKLVSNYQKELRKHLEDIKTKLIKEPDSKDERQRSWQRQVEDADTKARELELSITSDNVKSIKIKDLIGGLDRVFEKIAIKSDAFELTERPDRMSSEYQPELIGRPEDVENILSFLKRPSPTEGNGGTVAVLPIAGIGGLGKTLLAWSVYNREDVGSLFPLKIWVYVGSNNVRARILEYAEGQGYVGDISGYLIDKRYLIVLDDVQIDDKKGWMELMKSVLMHGARGSKIIVTTRRMDVAKIMGTEDSYDLPFLSNKDSFSLVSSVVFKQASESSSPPRYTAGKRIVDKCRGVPTVLKMLGKRLYDAQARNRWTEVEYSDILIPKILQVITDDIWTPDLMQCLEYCSFFPPNHEFNSVELIQFSDACGFFDTNEIKKDAIDLVEEDLNTLCPRYLKSQQEFFNWKFKMSKMLLHLTRGKVYDKFSEVLPSTTTIDKKIRHLLFAGSEFSSKLLQNIGSIQTLIFTKTIGRSSIESLIKRCKLLQVLILRDSSLLVLPSGIQGLKLLKYLDLGENKRVTKIPNSICVLDKLQTLILEGCVEIEQLPRDIRKLVRLTMLSITTKQSFLPENGIGCLRALRYLAIIGCPNLKYLPRGIHLLFSLRTFIVRDCGHLTSLPRSMKSLTALETLVIADCQNLHLWEGEEMFNPVHLNDIDIGLSLHRLWIVKLPQLSALPQWLVRKSAKTLQYLHIEDCQKLEIIPQWLEELTSLENTEILNCQKLSYPGITPSTILKKAEIEDCPFLTQAIESQITSNLAEEKKITTSTNKRVQEGGIKLDKGKGVWVDQNDIFETAGPAMSSLDEAGPSRVVGPSKAAAPAKGKVRRRYTILIVQRARIKIPKAKGKRGCY